MLRAVPACLRGLCPRDCRILPVHHLLQRFGAADVEEQCCRQHEERNGANNDAGDGTAAEVHTVWGRGGRVCRGSGSSRASCGKTCGAFFGNGLAWLDHECAVPGGLFLRSKRLRRIGVDDANHELFQARVGRSAVVEYRLGAVDGNIEMGDVCHRVDPLRTRPESRLVLSRIFIRNTRAHKLCARDRVVGRIELKSDGISHRDILQLLRFKLETPRTSLDGMHLRGPAGRR